MEGFKKHSVFCLEKNLGKFQAIFPRNKVGEFKGNDVFLRANIQDVKR
jgi:xeroderma pigmentosum group C-complementing protein